MKEEIIRFFEKHIIGKTLNTDEVIYKQNDDTLEGVYSDKMIFSDLMTTTNGFGFHMTTITHETLYQLDVNDIRTEIIKDFTGTSVFRYELALRKSTSQITGYMRCISTTVKDQMMEAVVYGVFDVKLKGNELTWKECQLLYRDTPVGEGKYKPVAFDSNIRFYQENNKTIFEYIPIYWDMNPETMEKVLSEDNYPLFISREK